MTLPIVIRRIVLPSLVPGACLAAIVYFAHHALFDSEGLRGLTRLESEVARRQETLAAQTKLRQKKEAEVRMLSSDSIDPDLLDERARAALGLARPDEFVIFDSQ